MVALLCGSGLCLAPPASQAGFLNQFIDRDDGWPDASEFLLRNAAGFLPVPTVITEPAIGEGVGLAAVFFHPPEDFDPDAEWQDGEFLMPNISAVDGDAPFFLPPYIDMRGIPALRYQAENVVMAETELRWSFHPRVGLVGFIGAGRAAESLDELGSASSQVAKGVGIRYFLMRMLGTHVGIDVAEGPEDTVWYLTIGSAW